MKRLLRRRGPVRGARVTAQAGRGRAARPLPPPCHLLMTPGVQAGLVSLRMPGGTVPSDTTVARKLINVVHLVLKYRYSTPTMSPILWILQVMAVPQ